jgi:ParB family chromosome partitioning protein
VIGAEVRPNRALGRGLAALIGDIAAESAPGAGVQDQLLAVPIERVRPNPEQPRARFAPGALQELAASIRQHGILQPMIVRRDPAGGYVLIAGERRLRAAMAAGLTAVPVVVRGAELGAREQLELALIENLQRADLDPIEAAEGYSKLVREHGLSQEQVATKVGKDRATVANALRLLKLPEPGRRALIEGAITAGHARALLGLDDPGRFAQALATVVARTLSVRATEALVRSLLAPRKPTSPDRTVERLARDLTRALATKVSVSRNAKGAGKIVVHFHDAAELDRLLLRIERP